MFAKIIRGMLLKRTLVYERVGFEFQELMAMWRTMVVVLMTPVKAMNPVTPKAEISNHDPQFLPIGSPGDAFYMLGRH